MPKGCDGVGERLIKPAENNIEKAYTYRQMKGRYNKAMSEKFYFEAMMIDYAMIEDRLRSFIYHIGGMNNRTSLKLDNKISKPFLLLLYNGYTKKKNIGLNLSNVSTKYNLIRAVLNWGENTDGTEGKYQQKLKFACESLDIDDVLNCLDELEKWCKYRNEVIHGLLNKNIISLNENLADKAEEGMKIALRIDSYVRVIKKGNIVRKSINLKT